MKLRKLIERLEAISKNKQNDDLEVRINNINENVDYDILSIGIDTFVSSNKEYDFISIMCD